MLCLYPDTIKMGHKRCSMLGILNEITLQKEWQHFMANNVFGQKIAKKERQKRRTLTARKSWASNSESLTPQFSALLLVYRDN